MELIFLENDFSVCKLNAVADFDFSSGLFFIGRTENEVSLLCETADVPKNAAVEHGWTGFYVGGKLDFSLVGILSKITGILACENIPVFAVSTYDTDYIFIKKENAAKAAKAFISGGYRVTYQEKGEERRNGRGK